MSYHFPNNWSIKSLGEIGRCVRGLTYSPDNVVDNGLLVLRSSNIQDGRLSFNDNVYVDLEIDEEFLSKKGDIVICVRNGSKHLIGKSAIVKDDNLKSTHGAFMTVFRSDLNDYIQHLINSDKFYQFVSRDIGATINSINTSNLLRYKFPIPPLPEQKKIAAILTSVDTVIEKTQAQIDKLKDLKTGMMQELLTKGIGHTEFKDSPVGWIPVEWEVDSIESFGISILDGDRGKEYPKEKDFFQNEYCLFLSAKNVTKHGFKFNETVYITKKKDDLLRKGKLIRNDIVITTRGTVGNIALYDDSISYNHIRINSGMAIIRNQEDKLDTEYLNLVLHSPLVCEQIELLAFGSAQPQLTIGLIKNLFIPKPDIEEQNKISKSIGSIQEKISIVESKLKSLQNTKKALMQDLLTGKVRLKV